MNHCSYAQFCRRHDLSATAVYTAFYENNRQRIPALREHSAIVCLRRIIEASFQISNRSGFQGMGLRDLSRAVGMSIGSLYRYIGSKDLLAQMILEHTQFLAQTILGQHAISQLAPSARLAALLRLHVYVSESLQAWFYFSYMEAKVLPPAQRREAVRGERATEDLLHTAIQAGQALGDFAPQRDARLTAAMLKGLLQDWYLKRGKYRHRAVSVDDYAQTAIDWAHCFLAPPGGDPSQIT